MFVCTEPGSPNVVEHAFMLYCQPRNGYRVPGIPLVWRRWLLGVRILRDLLKRPGAQRDGGRTFKEAVYATEQNMSRETHVGVSGEEDAVLKRGVNV